MHFFEDLYFCYRQSYNQYKPQFVHTNFKNEFFNFWWSLHTSSVFRKKAVRV